MQDYSISKSSRRCAISGQDFGAGESYFSVIVTEGNDVARIDISASHWQGPGENAIGWWRNKMPAAVASKKQPAPNAVLLDMLSDLLERPGKEELAYLLALLLVRRRVLQEEQALSLHDPTVITRIKPNDPACRSLGDSSSDSNDCQEAAYKQSWKLICPVDGREWIVPVVAPTEETLSASQAELQTLLFTDQ